VVLEGLDLVEVRTFTLREAVLAVKLELGSDNGVRSPAVHVKGSLGKNEGSGVRDGRSLLCSSRVNLIVRLLVDEGKIGAVYCAGSCIRVPGGSKSIGTNINGTSKLEKTRRRDETVGSRCLLGTSKGSNGVGKSINAVRVVEGLGTKSTVEDTSSIKGSAVIDVGIRLDNPDKLLARVVEVELDLVGGRTDRLVTSELDLLDQVLVGVLCHLATFVSVKEDIVYVKRSSNQRRLISVGNRYSSGD
jgi:hypothetical protein